MVTVLDKWWPGEEAEMVDNLVLQGHTMWSWSLQLTSAESQCWHLSPPPALDEPLIPGVSPLHLLSNASSVIFASDMSIVSDVVGWHNSNTSNDNNHVKLNKYRKGRAWAKRTDALASPPSNGGAVLTADVRVRPLWQEQSQQWKVTQPCISWPPGWRMWLGAQGTTFGLNLVSSGDLLE